MGLIKEMIEAAKLPMKFMFCIFFVSFALLFLPNDIMVTLHLKEFTAKYGIYVGIVMLGSGALLVSEITLSAWSRFKARQAIRKLNNSALDRLNRLDQSEKSVLREFYLQGQNTLQLPMDHPVVAGLISSGILTIGESGVRLAKLQSRVI